MWPFWEKTIFWEKNKDINLKSKNAIENEITPIICIGETLEEKEKMTKEVLVNKFKKVFLKYQILKIQ